MDFHFHRSRVSFDRQDSKILTHFIMSFVADIGWQCRTIDQVSRKYCNMRWTAIALRTHSGRCVAHGYLSVIVLYSTFAPNIGRTQGNAYRLGASRYGIRSYSVVTCGWSEIDCCDARVSQGNANTRFDMHLRRRRSAAMLCDMSCNFKNLAKWISGMLGKARDSLH